VLLVLAGTTVLGGQQNPADNAHYLLPATAAWTAPLPAPASAPGALDAWHVYVPLEDGRLLAVDRETGLERWMHAGPPPAAKPLAAGALIFVPAGGDLVALDAETGRERWRVRGAGRPLVADGGLLLATSPPDEITALDAASGETRWNRPIVDAPLQGSAAADGRFVVSLEDGRLLALAADDGAIVWQRQLPGVPGPVAAGGGRVTVGSTDNVLYTFDGRTGALLFRWRAGGDVVGAAVGPERIYYAALDNRLRAIDRVTGNQRWQVSLDTRPAFPPQIAGSVVVVSGLAPMIRAFDGRSGDAVGTYQAPAELRGPALVDPSPAPYAVALAVITRDGRAIGLRPNALRLQEPALAPLGALPGVTIPLR